MSRNDQELTGMKIMSVTEAKGKLTALVHETENEDVTLVRHGRPAAVMMSASRYDELLERLEDQEDALAVEQFRSSDEPTMEAGEFFAKLASSTGAINTGSGSATSTATGSGHAVS